MDFERTLETQRLKLLRIVAGLVFAVGLLSVGPVSRVFSDWACGFVGSILSRAEAAARYLVIARARSMMVRRGIREDQSRFSDALAHVLPVDEDEISASAYRRRLKALHLALLDLPRFAAHLIRRLQRQKRRTERACRVMPCPDRRLSASLRDWPLRATRIERPPDKGRSFLSFLQPPPEIRAGGGGGSAFQ